MEKTINFSSKDTQYSAQIYVDTDVFNLTIKEFRSGLSWSNSFSKDYIEDLTRKTGNFKSFRTVIKLLLASLENTNPNMKFDFLSYQDLELIRSKQSYASTPRKPSHKRYLIISYITDIEKANYPLPLSAVNESNSAGKTKRNDYGLEIDNKRLQEENSRLSKENNDLKLQFKSQKEKYLGEVDVLTKEKSSLEKDLDRLKDELDKIIDVLEWKCNEKSTIKNLELTVQNLESELEFIKLENQNLKLEIEKSKEIQVIESYPTQPQPESHFSSYRSTPHKDYESPGISESPDQSFIDRDVTETRLKQSQNMGTSPQAVNHLLNKLSDLCAKYKR